MAGAQPDLQMTSSELTRVMTLLTDLLSSTDVERMIDDEKKAKYHEAWKTLVDLFGDLRRRGVQPLLATMATLLQRPLTDETCRYFDVIRRIIVRTHKDGALSAAEIKIPLVGGRVFMFGTEFKIPVHDWAGFAEKGRQLFLLFIELRNVEDAAYKAAAKNLEDLYSQEYKRLAAHPKYAQIFIDHKASLP